MIATLPKVVFCLPSSRRGPASNKVTVTLSGIGLFENRGFKLSADSKKLKKTVQKIINVHNDEFLRLKKGEDKLIKFFIGQIMRETKGKYPPDLIIKIIKDSI